jgi:phosphatidylinositol glycan class B
LAKIYLIASRKGEVKTKRFHTYIVIIAAVVFAVSAYCSRGFHHFDEHFQILEFAGLKLGINQEKDLAWEYQEHMRPAIQPTVVVVLVKAMKAIGVESPFTWVMIIRMMTALFMLASIYCSTSALLRLIKPENRKLFIILSYFLYFMPYLAVRFSSETVSSGFFLLGFSLLVVSCHSSRIKTLPIAFGIGLLFGLSFICRFQSGIMIAGVLIWLIFVYRLGISQLIMLVLGVSVVIGIGTLVDHWFYGQWVFTPWNYFRTDVWVSSTDRFGTSPWYYYLSSLYSGDTKSILKLLLLISGIYFLFSNSRDVVAFAVIPFVLIHFAIAHKEMRFMIPVVFFVPYITVIFWQYIISLAKSNQSVRVLQLVLYQALFINAFSLMANVIKPADGQPLVYEYIYDHYHGTPVDIYYLKRGGNFFWAQALLPMNFYYATNNQPQAIGDNDISGIATGAGRHEALLIAQRSVDLSHRPVKPLYSTKPEWLQRFDFNDWMKIKNDDWVVYKITSAKNLSSK